VTLPRVAVTASTPCPTGMTCAEAMATPSAGGPCRRRGGDPGGTATTAEWSAELSDGIHRVPPSTLVNATTSYLPAGTRTCSSQFRVAREPGPRCTTCAAERYTLRSQAAPFPGAASTHETWPVEALLRVFQTCAVTATVPPFVEASTLSRRTVGAEGSVVSLKGPRPHAADVTRSRTTTAE
jgi:hypothetical protein